MKNLARLLGIPIIAAATIFSLKCDLNPPTLPHVPKGTVNASFLNGPYTYDINVFATASGNSSNSTMTGVNRGNTSCSLSLAPDNYDIKAQGLEYINIPSYPYVKVKPHYPNEEYQISVSDGGIYSVTFTMN